MATLNGNNAYLAVDGKNLSGLWTGEIDFSKEIGSVETTRGAGQTHVQRAATLIDTKMKFGVVYDDVELASYVQKLEPGKKYVVWGPEGTTAGKPCHAGYMILKSVSGPNPGVEKPMVMFEMDFEQADIPDKSITRGDTF